MSDSETSSEVQENELNPESDENDSDSDVIDMGVEDSDDASDDDSNDGEASGEEDEQVKKVDKKTKLENAGKKTVQSYKKENGIKPEKEQDNLMEPEIKDSFERKKLILEKYEKLIGKQLFIRFPKALPKTPKEAEKYVKEFNERIINVTRPRQKSVRHCLVQFDNEKDRKKAMEELRKVEIDGVKLIVGIPKTEDKEYLERISNYQAKKYAKFMEIRKAKKLAKQNQKQKNLTSTIIVENIPSSATATDVKALFPEAVELRFTVAKGIENTSQATITLPSTLDASQAKRKKHKIGENDLKITFANKLGVKKSNKKKKKQPNNIGQEHAKVNKKKNKIKSNIDKRKNNKIVEKKNKIQEKGSKSNVAKKVNMVAKKQNQEKNDIKKDVKKKNFVEKKNQEKSNKNKENNKSNVKKNKKDLTVQKQNKKLKLN